nr:uncharacterized protein LOC100177786 isoform X2 [Ciona intestinalis]|eukprot:XP_018670901.1 uncharacterized protein LOC100177786 isoform X2 [Ciona intestinalis]
MCTVSTYSFSRKICTKIMLRKISLLFLIFCLRGRTCLSENATEVTDEELDNVMSYLKSFTSLTVPEPVVGSSSSGGDGPGIGERMSKKEFAESPVFMENVIIVQASAGIPQTGKIDRNLIQTMGKSRCGMSDPPPPGSGVAFYTEQSTWRTKRNPRTQKYELNYSFFPNTYPSDGSISRTDIEKGITAAMCLWEMNSNVRFTGNLGPGVSSADVTISFGRRDHGDPYPFDGKGKTLAHAFYPESGKLHFDLDEPWFLSMNNNNQRRKKDIFTVAAHELGHTLGLAHSEVRGSLMAPYYLFTTSFENYLLPRDDTLGIQSMYGRRIGSVALNDRNSACYQLRSLYGAETAGSTQTNRPVPPPTTTTATTTTTTTTAQPSRNNNNNNVPSTATLCVDRLSRCSTYKRKRYCTLPQYRSAMARQCPKTCNMCVRGEAPCEDNPTYAVYCASWKRQKLCTHPQQVRAMANYCKKTCGLCPVVVDHKPSPAAIPTDSVCSITKFDTIMTLRANSGLFYAYFLKDDYVFPMEVSVQQAGSYSLLNETYQLGDRLRWRYDPKTIKRGMIKYNKAPYFTRSGKIHALMKAPSFILAFGGNNVVDEYREDGPHHNFAGRYLVGEAFTGYPHHTVDATYTEYMVINREAVLVYTLFYGDKIWQFQERKTILDSGSNRNRVFDPLPGRSGILTKQWKGVYACNVDAVIEYQRIPYYVKGNTFWPATNETEAIARDLTYNLLRCWRYPPETPVVPKMCGRSASPRNPNSSSSVRCQFPHFVIALILFLLFN